MMSSEPNASQRLDRPQPLEGSQDYLTLLRLTVAEDRVSALVKTAVPFTFPGLSAAAEQQFPDLPLHPCVNDCGPQFGAVMAATSLPHLLEHIVISLQAADPLTPDELPLLGTTVWLDRRQGLARVEVTFGNDLVVLRAFRDGCQFLNETLRRLLS